MRLNDLARGDLSLANGPREGRSRCGAGEVAGAGAVIAMSGITTHEAVRIRRFGPGIGRARTRRPLGGGADPGDADPEHRPGADHGAVHRQAGTKHPIDGVLPAWQIPAPMARTRPTGSQRLLADRLPSPSSPGRWATRRRSPRPGSGAPASAHLRQSAGGTDRLLHQSPVTGRRLPDRSGDARHRGVHAAAVQPASGWHQPGDEHDRRRLLRSRTTRTGSCRGVQPPRPRRPRQRLRDLDEAIEVASKIPGARLGTIEVRPLWEM